MAADAGAARQALKPGGLDPFRATWRLLTNVKFALLLVGMAAAASMIGVLIPQLPAEMRGNPAAQAAWLELRREDYGGWTDPMIRLDLFEVFRSPWFVGLWLLIIVAVTVCTVSRFLPTWRSVQRPQKQVADAYFEQARHRASFSHGGGGEAVEALLRKRRYRVERTKQDGEASYLFAERFAWSQYGTFLSHLALLMLLVGGLLTSLAGFDTVLALAETAPAAPVFRSPGQGQIFLGITDAVRGIDENGNIVDYRSFLQIRRGDQVVTCHATVNDPCHAFGYKFHQAAFFDDLARLRIEAPDGRLLYNDLVDFNGEVAAAPRLRVTDASGAILFDQAIPQLGTDPGTSAGRQDDVAISQLAFPGIAGGGIEETVSVPVVWRSSGGRMLLVVNDGLGEPEELTVGEAHTLVAGPDTAYRIAFTGIEAIPAIRIADMPGADGETGVVVQMPAGDDGQPYLVVSGIDEDPALLTPGRRYTNNQGYTYTFGGRLEGAGINVKRDPGDTFIWVAVAMALAGLAITFYVPRRRLWVKITPDRTQMAGIAERTTRFGRELRRFGAELGSRDALLPEDVEEPY
jgi:cytochrome c biogenesis protein